MTRFQKSLATFIVLTAVGAGVFVTLQKNDSQPPLLGKEPQPDSISGTGRNSRVGLQAPTPPAVSPASVALLMSQDAPASSDPVESAVANGVVLDSRIEKAAEALRWTRTRLVKTEVVSPLVRVVESWQVDTDKQLATCLRREMFLADQLILKVARGVDEARLQRELAPSGIHVQSMIAKDTFTVRLPKADLDATPEALQFLADHPELVESAEPDGVGFGGGTPNDSRFSEQWGCHNTGQLSGTVNADVDAPEFWDIVGSTPGAVIAVLDSGLNFTHPDLQNIAWINPGEISGDGIDNDSNGKVDDINGWDFVNSDNAPGDDHGHGSNVTGIIAATRNNGQGIAGMLSGVRIIVCKILNSGNSGLTSDLIAATAYARQLGVPVMNLSLQNYPFSSTLNTEFTACQSAGILLSICAGNQGVNNDSTPNYPSSYTHSNIIAVGNHDQTDVRWSGAFAPSNYGAVSVDLFAPGREILSPILGTSYSFYTGTSQATPFVTAVCAAIKYANPTWSALTIKNSIMTSVITKASYSGLCLTGGRLNAVTAVAHAFRQLPSQDTDGDQFSNLFEYLTGTQVNMQSSRPAVFNDISGGFIRIGVPRILRPDAHLEVETSIDLSTWTTIGVTDFSTPETLLGGISVSGAPRGFIRIRAVPTP